ncbi:hypothetical protein HBH64_013110 [Parastagonospora nodorum]|nr:hypothetical protein HBI95_018840 [Parastagonospora nodorum]KAH4298727.1 hypothetical protein HBI01_122210 [Parastagonospora nodorum]KAH4313468.1 hypothetical protein HBI02_075680 [Parastagonospora nodorum]KAH4336220.1 hypothetical protein HBI00_029290 [Parastagonospora nodorum]KAH4384678.1 hypothetical protein HBH94_056190 [Parastagonospora nodorum]
MSSNLPTADPSPEIALPPRPSQTPTNSPRLGMPFDRRLLLTTFLSGLCGFTLGSTSAGRLASLRFRAENAHRLPISQPGWYLYHKSKNYYKWRAGITEGLRKGGLVAAWSSVFFIVEESLDIFRGTWRAGRSLSEMEGVDELDIARVDRGVGKSRDAWSSAGAGMVTGGLWSAWHGFPVSTAGRTIRMGVLGGLGFGLVQDGVRWAKERWGEEEGESWVRLGAKNRQGEGA